MSDSQHERDPETLALFIEESLEGLQRIEKLLLLAEKGTLSQRAEFSTVFRDVHTIKGTPSFLALKKEFLGLSHAAGGEPALAAAQSACGGEARALRDAARGRRHAAEIGRAG